jgi:hypothetical protein
MEKMKHMKDKWHVYADMYKEIKQGNYINTAIYSKCWPRACQHEFLGLVHLHTPINQPKEEPKNDTTINR